MIDFKRLGGMTAEDRAAREAKRVQDEKDADAKRRAEWSQTTIDAQLTDDAELRASHSGDTMSHPSGRGAIDEQPAPPRGGSGVSGQAGKVAPRCKGLGDFCGPLRGPRWRGGLSLCFSRVVVIY